MEAIAGSDDDSLGVGSDSDADSTTSAPEADLVPESGEIREARILPFPAVRCEHLIAAEPLPTAEPAPVAEPARVTESAPAVDPATPAVQPVEIPAEATETDTLPGDLTAAPGVQLATLLATLDPALLSGRQILDGIAGFDRTISWMTGLQQRWLTAAAVPGAVVDKDSASAMAEVREDVDLDELQSTEPDVAQALLVKHTIHLAGQELAPLLAMAHSTAKLRIAEATDIVTNLPMIHRAILDGVLSPYRASLIAAGTSTMTEDTRKLAAQVLLKHGARLAISRLKKLIRKTAATLDRDAFNALAKEARRNRDVQIYPDEHGMARLWAVLPADQAVLVQGIIDELANHLFKLQQCNSEITQGSELWRSKGEMRADAFAEIMVTLATNGFVDIRDYLNSESQDVDKAGASAPGFETHAPQSHSPSHPFVADSPAADSDVDSDNVAAVADSKAPAVSSDADVISDSAAIDIASVDNQAGEPDLSTALAPPRPRPDHTDQDDTDRELTDQDHSDQDNSDHDHSDREHTDHDDTHREHGLARSFDAPKNLRNPLIKPTGLNLTMSLETLLQLRKEPGYLDTFDTIPDHLRDGILKSAASVTVMLLDNCGTLLDLGKTARFPNTRLSKYLEERDVTCRFPGCNNNARRADLDHQQPWRHRTGERTPSAEAVTGRPVTTAIEGQVSEPLADSASRSSSGHSDGETCAGNMAALCRTHHLMKHHTNWEVRHGSDHSLNWTTPNGHLYSTTPNDWRLSLPAEQIAVARKQLAARQAAEEQEAARVQAEIDAKYPDIPPF